MECKHEWLYLIEYEPGGTYKCAKCGLLGRVVADRLAAAQQSFDEIHEERVMLFALSHLMKHLMEERGIEARKETDHLAKAERWMAECAPNTASPAIIELIAYLKERA